jgi:hypothetical protein
MKKIILILTIFFYNYNFSYGQTTIKDATQFNAPEIPQERVYLHYNSSLLLSGEHLLFTIYCINTKTKKLSNLSKIAYVELIGTDKKSVFKQKIWLESGIGQSDYFIPTNLSSGNYKLIAYTQWMQNGEIENFFQGDISIINPFQENQGSITSIEKLDTIPNPTNDAINSEFKLTNSKNINNKFIKLETTNQTFSHRDKVILKIKGLFDRNSFGNYSISVRKIDSIEKLTRVTAVNYINKLKSNLSPIGLPNYLPELRGELLSGKITSNNQENNVANKKVILTISGKYPIFKIANINNEGIFYFNLNSDYTNSEALVQVFGHKKEDFNINFKQKSAIDYSDLIFNNFNINSNMKAFILDRSIQNQIENAYDSVKSNSIHDLKKIRPFHPTTGVLEYNLDDYTRFPTVKETFVEIIDKAWLIKEKENYKFRMRGNEANYTSPIVLVDGILIHNHNTIVDFSAKKIKKITIIQDKYSYGSQKFEGIISIETLNNDFKNNISTNYITPLELFPPERKKTYFNQIYNNGQSLDRIPDFRNQLLWEPNFILNKKEEIITFYTSDNSGDYEICLEGFTKNGNPVSVRQIISVK